MDLFKRFCPVLCLALALSCGLQATADGAEGTKYLTIDQYMSWEQAARARISPDGAKILYTRSAVDVMEDRWVPAIWVMEADGSGKRFVANGGGAQWSTDSKNIAYVARGAEGKPQIFRYAADGGGRPARGRNAAA